MRDHQSGMAAGYAGKFFLNRFFGFGIERRGRLVEDQDARILQYGACDGYALLFSAGKFKPAFTHRRGVAFGQAFDEIVDMRRTCRLQHFVACRAGAPVMNVVENRVIEQHSVLRHDADGCT